MLQPYSVPISQSFEGLATLAYRHLTQERTTIPATVAFRHRGASTIHAHPAQIQHSLSVRCLQWNTLL